MQESDNQIKNMPSNTVLFWSIRILYSLVAMGGDHEIAAKNADRNFEHGQASMARWSETVVEKTLVLPADFGVNLSLLAAHTARSR